MIPGRKARDHLFAQHNSDLGQLRDRLLQQLVVDLRELPDRFSAAQSVSLMPTGMLSTLGFRSSTSPSQRPCRSMIRLPLMPRLMNVRFFSANALPNPPSVIESAGDRDGQTLAGSRVKSASVCYGRPSCDDCTAKLPAQIAPQLKVGSSVSVLPERAKRSPKWPQHKCGLHRPGVVFAITCGQRGPANGHRAAETPSTSTSARAAGRPAGKPVNITRKNRPRAPLSA